MIFIKIELSIFWMNNFVYFWGLPFHRPEIFFFKFDIFYLRLYFINRKIERLLNHYLLIFAQNRGKTDEERGFRRKSPDSSQLINISPKLCFFAIILFTNYFNKKKHKKKNRSKKICPFLLLSFPPYPHNVIISPPPPAIDNVIFAYR